jgi:predicted metal-dependent hydrolase
VLTENTIILTVQEDSTAAKRGNLVREWYRELLKTKIAQSMPEWECKTGLRSSGWQTRYMKTRWGTCNTKTGKIWLNVRLAEKPPECLEYVILHELAHLVERTHNERFVSFMDAHMPEWRRIKAELNGRTADRDPLGY